MKKLLLVILAVIVTDALSGCIVVPAHEYAYRPARVVVY
jgi:hypothetical protein